MTTGCMMNLCCFRWPYDPGCIIKLIKGLSITEHLSLDRISKNYMIPSGELLTLRRNYYFGIPTLKTEFHQVS